MKQYDKPIIYQVIPRLFGNLNGSCVKHGRVNENGSGKFSSFTPKALTYRAFQFTHCTQTVKCTFVDIECAVQPESKMHSMNALIMIETKPFL